MNCQQCGAGITNPKAKTCGYCGTTLSKDLTAGTVAKTAQAIALTRKRAQIVEFLEQNAPDLLQRVVDGELDEDEAVSLYEERQRKAERLEREIQQCRDEAVRRKEESKERFLRENEESLSTRRNMEGLHDLCMGVVVTCFGIGCICLVVLLAACFGTGDSKDDASAQALAWMMVKCGIVLFSVGMVSSVLKSLIYTRKGKRENLIDRMTV